MPEIKSKEETTQLRAFSRKRVRKELLFGEFISTLTEGQSLFISEEEWPLKGTPSNYYNLRVNKAAGVKMLRITAVEGGWLLEKLVGGPSAGSVPENNNH
jgi:hypothetical protein